VRPCCCATCLSGVRPCCCATCLVCALAAVPPADPPPTLPKPLLAIPTCPHAHAAERLLLHPGPDPHCLHLSLQILDSHMYLAARNLSRPERMVHDAAISVGYMHAGYPIMTFLDVVEGTLDPQAGHWGHLHELGHNFQDGPWTWGCTGEVSCNWFAARASAVVKNLTNPANFYGWWGDDMTTRADSRKTYFASGPSYSQICGNLGLSLDSFLQVGRACCGMTCCAALLCVRICCMCVGWLV
jgi:hypothetical protein